MSCNLCPEKSCKIRKIRETIEKPRINRGLENQR